MSIILGVILIVGIIYAQRELSSKSDKFLGLNFPLISFVFSLLFIFITYSADGFSFENILGFIFMLALYNIFTIILLVIYYVSRKHVKEIKEITKMNIYDLN